MTTRQHAPNGTPCWADLSTSDVEGVRRFYGELFGWEAQDPNPEFGGYFMFTKDGVPVAGAMGPMGDMPGRDLWQIYLASPDVEMTLETAATEGAGIVSGAMPVADLGTQAIIVDPTGANLGIWQPGTFPGFTVLDEPGTPSWFELHTRDHAAAMAFYQKAFSWKVVHADDDDSFRYSVVAGPDGGDGSAGVMDASSFLPEGTPSHWSVYWSAADAAATAARVTSLGGSVVAGPEDTPYGVLATCLDPAGAQFKLRTPPR